MDCTSPTLEAALAAERAHCGTLPAHLRERQLIGTVLWAPPRSCTLPCMVAAYGNASSAPSSPRRRHRHGWEKVEVVGWSSFTALAASQPYDVCYLWSRHQPRGTNVAWSAERFDECLLVSTSRLSTAAVALSSPPPLRSPGLVRRKMQGDEICDESFRRRAIEDEWVRPECDFAAAAAFSHGAKGERARAVLDWRRWVGIDVGVKQRSTRCSWCGRTDHLRRNSRACPFYAGYGATAAARRRDKARALAKQALPREDEDEDDEASSAGGGVTTPPAAAAAQSAARLAGKRKRRRRDGVPLRQLRPPAALEPPLPAQPPYCGGINVGGGCSHKEEANQNERRAEEEEKSESAGREGLSRGAAAPSAPAAPTAPAVIFVPDHGTHRATDATPRSGHRRCRRPRAAHPRRHSSARATPTRGARAELSICQGRG